MSIRTGISSIFNKICFLGLMATVISAFILMPAVSYAMEEKEFGSDIIIGGYLVIGMVAAEIREAGQMAQNARIKDYRAFKPVLQALTRKEMDSVIAGTNLRVSLVDLQVTLLIPGSLVDPRQVPGARYSSPDTWEVIDHFKINREYYDVGMEQYGWEIIEKDWGEPWYNAGLKGIDDKPVTVRKIDEHINYDPHQRIPEKNEENLFGNKATTWTEVSHYRHGYWVFFQY